MRSVSIQLVTACGGLHPIRQIEVEGKPPELYFVPIYFYEDSRRPFEDLDPVVNRRIFRLYTIDNGVYKYKETK